MRTIRLVAKGSLVASALALICFAPVYAGEDALAAPPLLAVAGEVEKPATFTAGDLLKNLPRQTVRTKEKEKEVVYEGVLATEVLKRAGMKLGDKQMRREKLLLYILAEATDGYKVLFSLSEFDPDLTDKVFLIADRRDGQPHSSGCLG